MTTHLIEAIVLNVRRMPRYARMSQGRSLPVSLLLAASEALSLPTSFLMDQLAKYWQRRGVPVFQYEFVPMSEVTSFSSDFPFAFSPLGELPTFDLRSKAMVKTLRNRDYGALRTLLQTMLKELGPNKHVYCMTRHTLESFLRCANLTSWHIAQAKRLGVRSPEKFCLLNLWSHQLVLRFCRLLDVLAFPLQDKGIPIIYQDVPAISAHPDQLKVSFSK